MASETAYRSDFRPPLTGDKLIKAVKNQKSRECELFCQSQQQVEKKHVPKTIDAEWTGIGPMGRLIDPRLIPFQSTTESTEDDTYNIKKIKCVDDKQSQFLEMVRKCYPHIYEKWYNWPSYKWQIDNERINSVYKKDYCKLEIPKEKIHKEYQKYRILDKIMEETVPPECQAYYKPFNISFLSLPDDEHHESNYGPYLLDPEPKKISEYMAKTSRTGCIITRNALHKHVKTCEKSCLHKLGDQCKNYS